MPGLESDTPDIAPLQKEQFDEAAKLYQQIWYDEEAYAEIFTDDEARKEIEKFNHPLVALFQGAIVGLVGGMPLADYIHTKKDRPDQDQNRHIKPALNKLLIRHGKCYYIDTLAIASNYRNKKLAKRLFTFFIDDRSRNGFTSFLLRTTLHHKNPAWKLYRGFKFEPLVDDFEDDSSGRLIVEVADQRRRDCRSEKDWRAYLLMTGSDRM